jgi:hypothetical protein
MNEIDAAKYISKAIEAIGISQNVNDSNFEPANLVDALEHIARALNRIATAIDNTHP